MLRPMVTAAARARSFPTPGGRGSLSDGGISAPSHARVSSLLRDRHACGTTSELAPWDTVTNLKNSSVGAQAFPSGARSAARIGRNGIGTANSSVTTTRITTWFSASPMGRSIHQTVLARACPNSCLLARVAGRHEGRGEDFERRHGGRYFGSPEGWRGAPVSKCLHAEG